MTERPGVEPSVDETVTISSPISPNVEILVTEFNEPVPHMSRPVQPLDRAREHWAERQRAGR